jgi:hypothetical protein
MDVADGDMQEKGEEDRVAEGRRAAGGVRRYGWWLACFGRGS